ncbi:MAG: KdsC family phosphatase [Myxococcales bacterium]
MKLSKKQLLARARKVELLVLDVDGVLTDGGLYYGHDGEAMKRFDVRDGHGLTLARRVGLRAAILTARRSQIVQVRGEELGISPVFQGRKDKLAGFEELLADTGLAPEQTAYVGDDLNDLGPLALAGLSACPADACAEVRRAVHYVARAAGGHGAVREIVELLLKAQGKWSQVIELMKTRGFSPPKGR